ncbi:MAG: hypothetical protein P8X84_02340 [Candidatus Bathyarchaeota archaeon]
MSLEDRESMLDYDPFFCLVVVCLGWGGVIKTLRWLKKIREQKTMKK